MPDSLPAHVPPSVSSEEIRQQFTGPSGKKNFAFTCLLEIETLFGNLAGLRDGDLADNTFNRRDGNGTEAEVPQAESHEQQNIGRLTAHLATD